MTRGTGTDDIIMIYRVGRNRCPARRELLVTQFAAVRGVDMCWALSASLYTIVTGNTVGHE